MVDAQGGDVSAFEDLKRNHKPGASQVLEAWSDGFIADMDTTSLGWAVQRTGAGREKAGEPVDPYAGIEFHAKRGARVKRGQPLATIYATKRILLAEPMELVRNAIRIAMEPPKAVKLIGRIFTREKAEAYLRDAVR